MLEEKRGNEVIIWQNIAKTSVNLTGWFEKLNEPEPARVP